MLGIATIALTSWTGARKLEVSTASISKPPNNFTEFRDPARKFALLYHKDWKTVQSFGETVATFVQTKFEAVVVVERRIVPDAFDTNSQAFLDTERRVLETRHPDAQGIKSGRVQEAQKGVVFDFTRQRSGVAEQLRQYSFVVDTMLFRVTCISPQDKFKKYEGDYLNVARNVRALSEPTAGSLLGAH